MPATDKPQHLITFGVLACRISLTYLSLWKRKGWEGQHKLFCAIQQQSPSWWAGALCLLIGEAYAGTSSLTGS